MHLMPEIYEKYEVYEMFTPYRYEELSLYYWTWFIVARKNTLNNLMRLLLIQI